MLILVFKAINGLAPNYISNLVNILCPSKYLLRRNNKILLEPYNCRTHLVESYNKESNICDSNWLRYHFSSYLMKIWLGVWRHFLAI